MKNNKRVTYDGDDDDGDDTHTSLSILLLRSYVNSNINYRKTSAETMATLVFVFAQRDEYNCFIFGTKYTAVVALSDVCAFLLRSILFSLQTLVCI